MNALPCITLWQPWASWIAAGWKPTESRTHPHLRGLVGRRIGIHAGLKWDENALEIAGEYLTAEQRYATREFAQVRGMLIATAAVAAHRQLKPADSAAVLFTVLDGQLYGLELVNVQPLSLPIPMPGKQGVWYSPVEINP